MTQKCSHLICQKRFPAEEVGHGAPQENQVLLPRPALDRASHLYIDGGLKASHVKNAVDRQDSRPQPRSDLRGQDNSVEPRRGGGVTYVAQVEQEEFNRLWGDGEALVRH